MVSNLSRISFSLFPNPCTSQFLKNQTKSDTLNFPVRRTVSCTNFLTSSASLSSSEHVWLIIILDTTLFESLRSSPPTSTASPAFPFLSISLRNLIVSCLLTGSS
ncbi:hypothetical protein VIGAN_04284200 [Vigna angularis var. angularis]|uniref:Uncharacterized protein n=1 Tax=Vigna angularis var. angularis TaxID=157739 RepID=A0A0S3RXT8_PHAAN|nr:hypothetical protein VIGAN_04284200 [Vigna angularis var. angularis]